MKKSKKDGKFGYPKNGNTADTPAPKSSVGLEYTGKHLIGFEITTTDGVTRRIIFTNTKAGWEAWPPFKEVRQ